MKPGFPKGLVKRASRQQSNRPSMISIVSATAALARREGTGLTIIIFGCWRSRLIACRSPKSPHVELSSERRNKASHRRSAACRRVSAVIGLGLNGLA